MWSFVADLENDTVDEEPLFADDLDEYEEQDEEDDPPPLPPPIQTTPQRDQGMPAVNLYASINVLQCMRTIGEMGRDLNFYLIIFHVLLGTGDYNVPNYINAPSLGQVHFLNPQTISLISLAGIDFDSSWALAVVGQVGHLPYQ